MADDTSVPPGPSGQQIASFESEDVRHWDCNELFSGTATDPHYAMIILNQPIVRDDVFQRAWHASELQLIEILLTTARLV